MARYAAASMISHAAGSAAIRKSSLDVLLMPWLLTGGLTAHQEPDCALRRCDQTIVQRRLHRFRLCRHRHRVSQVCLVLLRRGPETDLGPRVVTELAGSGFGVCRRGRVILPTP